MDIRKKITGIISDRYVNTALFILFEAWALISFINRAVRGAELTDEIFYSALGYRIAAGNIPIKEMWELQQTTYILFYPFFALYKALFGTEGIQLALRFFNILLSAAACVPMFIWLKGIIPKKSAALICTAYVVYAPMCLVSLGYNNVLLHFTVVFTSFLLLGVQREKPLFFFLGGVFMALAGFCYPTQVIACLIMAALLPVMLKIIKSGGTVKYSLWFICGGGAAAAVIMLVLVIVCGPAGFITGIKGMLSDAAYTGEHKALSDYFLTLWHACGYILIPMKRKKLLCFCLITALLFIVKKGSLIPAALAAFFPMMAYNSITHFPGDVMQIILFCLPLLMADEACRKDRDILAVMLFRYIPACIVYAVICLTSAGTFIQANNAMIIQAVSAAEAMFIMVSRPRTVPEGKEKPAKYPRVREIWQKVCSFFSDRDICGRAAGMFFTATMIFYIISCFEGFVYRDGPLSQCTEKITAGPFKGIYTTRERKDYIESTTLLLRDMRQEGKSVCVLYRAAYAYLMLEGMTPCSPALWGIYDNYNNEESFLLYFDTVAMPDCIYIVEPAEGFELNAMSSAAADVSVLTPRLTAFMEENYTLERSEQRELSARVTVYGRKPLSPA